MISFSTLKFKIFSIILFFLTVFLAFNFYYSYNKINEESDLHLNTINSSTVSILSKQLITDIYEINYSEVKYIIDTYSSELIQNIFILTHDGYILSQKNSNDLVYKKFDNFDNIKNIEKINKFLHKYPVKLLDKTIGYIVIVNSQEQYKKELERNIVKLEILFIEIFVLILLISYLFTRIIVLPINSIIRDISDVSVDKPLDINYKQDDELGYLSRAIELRHNQVSRLNDELKEKILNVTNMNETIQKQQDMLIQQSKMVAMGEMISNIGHQWRQPLSAISTLSSGLELENEFGTLSDYDIKKSCRGINSNVQYLSKTLDMFQSFMKVEKRKEHLNLKKIAKNSMNIMKGVLKEYDIKVEIDIDDTIEFDGDSTELTQCIINIFNNSKDAFLSSENDNNRTFFISGKKLNSNIELELQDNAGGIDPNIISKVYEPYFTTKHQSQGTGLGLYITYNLITERLHGTINLFNCEYLSENRIFRGVCCKIIFPC